MKKLLLSLFFTLSFGAWASHTLGGHSNVTQLGQYTYLVEITLYQETAGLSAPPYVTYHLFKSNGGFYNLQTTYQNGALQDTNFVYHNRLISKFSDTITLTSPGDYRIVCTEGGRVNYTNMSNNASVTFGTDFANYAVQGSTAFVPNSPPAFVTIVPGKLITGVQNQFSVFAIDPDGDSISYEYGDAKDLHLNSTFVPVAPQSSLTTNFSQAGGGYSVTNYGIVTWSPSVNGKFGNSIIVREYRNGQMIGVNRLELTYNTVAGSTIPITNLNNIIPAAGVWETTIYPPQSWTASFDVPSNCSVVLFGNEIKNLITITNNSGSVSFSISNTSILEPGVYPIVVRVTNGSIETDNLLFIYVMESNIGIEEKKIVNFYPNPVQNRLYVETPAELITQVGVVKTLNAGWNDLSQLPNGIYYIYSDGVTNALLKME